LFEKAKANGLASLGKYPKGIQHQRKIFVGGNWKSNGDKIFINEFPKTVLNNLKHNPQNVEVVVAPTNLHLTTVQSILNENVSVST